MPAEGTVSLTLPATVSDGLAVVKCTSPSEVLEGLSATPPAGYLLGTTDAAVVLKQPTLPSGSGSDSGALSSGAAEALREVAAAAGLPTISAVSGTTCTGKEEATALDAATLSSALEVFSGIATADEANSTISVVYDFGIAEMNQTGSNIEVVAKVQKPAVGNDAPEAAAFAEGVTVQLLDEKKNVLGEVTPNAGTATFTKSAASLAGKTLSVRAKKGASGN